MEAKKLCVSIDVWEESALGTAGALALVDGFIHDHVLMMNSYLLTNIDFEDLFLFFEEHGSRFGGSLYPLSSKCSLCRNGN